MKHIIQQIIFGLTFFSLVFGAQFCNVPKPDNSQWFCSTIADQQNADTSINQRALGFKTKFWPVGYQFKVGFIGGSTQQKDLVKSTCTEWEKYGNYKFSFPASGPYDIRISFNPNGGAWSYVGIDCKNISQSSPTMNLGWIASDAYLHEFGHTLGLLHEHQSPDQPIKWNEAQVIKDLQGPPNNWTVDMIKFNVLNPYPLPNVITTALDKTSIMMYPIPSTWTLDGFSTPGGKVISSVDKAFIGARYPFSQPPTTGSVTLRKGQVDTLLIQYQRVLSKFDSVTLEMNRMNEATKKAFGRVDKY